jgi:hypothetical protein
VQLVVEKCEADEHGVEQARRLIANGVDGIILPPPLCDTRKLIDLIAASGTRPSRWPVASRISAWPASASTTIKLHTP